MPPSATQRQLTTDKEIHCWLRKWYPLLLVEQAKIEFDNAARGIANPMSDLEIELIGREFDDRRQQQWLALKQRALVPGQQTEFARQALVYLICAASCGPSEDRFAFWLAAESAHTLNHICGSEPDSQTTFEQLASLLLSPHAARTGCVATLFQALDALRTMVDDPAFTQQSDEMVLSALKASIERTRSCPAQEEPYQLILLAELSNSAYRPALPALQAIADHHPLETIQQAAANVLIDLSNVSVKAIYDHTTPDPFSSEEGKAGRLGEALTKQYSANVMVQEIFNNCKGSPLSGAEDPRLASIFSLTSHAEQTVVMAASWMLAASQQVPPPLKEPAVRTLVEIAEASETPLLARQAEDILAALCTDAHSLSGIIESARLAVRLRCAREHTSG